MDIMKERPKASAKTIADELSITSRAVEKNIAAMKEPGLIACIGVAKGGHWEVKVPEK